ncbi:hypothetical protein GJAV_G00126370 [Gymnothorax javanicus]|nr:hypothetical protein GJAV_G00126370 [Gymnothorax javanicus]
MDLTFCYLLLLSLSLCSVPTVSVPLQTNDVPTSRAGTARTITSVSTLAPVITAAPSTTTLQITPFAENTTTLSTSGTDPKSVTSLPTSSRGASTETSTSESETKRSMTPGNTRRTETTSKSSPPANTSTRRLTPDTTTVQPVSTAAERLPTMPGTSSVHPTGPDASVSPTPSTGNSLTKLAFGVMSFILILIIIMVALVTAIHLRGRCDSSKEEGKKSGDSLMSESQVTSIGEKENITLVSVKTINTETDTDSPQISSIHSTTLDSEEQELRRDLLNNKV